MKIWSYVLVCILAVASLDAMAARRLGGGQSVGKQSPQVAQREAAPANAPAAPVAAPNAAAKPAAAAPQAARKPWGAMLGGLAAGLGLAWLAHSLGFGAEMAQFLLIALVVGAVMLLIGVFRARRSAASHRAPPFAFQGAGNATPDAVTPRQYRPENVGNDASARPWEGSSTHFDAAAPAGKSSVTIGSALGSAAGWGIPADFDRVSFVDAAKRSFVTLQAAWDRSDIPTLRAMMTDSMLDEIRNQLAEREKHMAGQANHTEVVLLEAQLLGIEELSDEFMASVEFSGMIREEPSAGPSPFREVWNMTKPKNGSSGWLVAGVQALQ